MKQYMCKGYPFSEWTNKMLEKVEKQIGCELNEFQILMLMDYLVGFVSEKDDYVQQALEATGLSDDDEPIIFLIAE